MARVGITFRLFGLGLAEGNKASAAWLQARGFEFLTDRMWVTSMRNIYIEYDVSM